MERLNFIVEKETIWQRLKHIDKPIVIYGMGDGALKIFDKCQKDRRDVCKRRVCERSVV